MPATTPKGIRKPTNTDPFDPVADMGRMADDVDELLPGGAWGTSPIGVSQPGPVAFDATNAIARWVKTGRLVTVHADIPLTAAGVAGNALRVYLTGLPQPRASIDRGCGSFWYFDAGANNRMGVCQLNTDDGLYFTFWVDNAGVGVTQFGQGPSIAAANGDRVVLTAHYESAA